MINNKIKIRGHLAQNIKGCLYQFHYQYTQRRNGYAYLYILVGKKLFPLKKMTFKLLRRLVRHTFIKKSLPIIVKLPFNCDYVKVKNNLRIFGYGSGNKLSVKIAVNSMYRKGNLFREIKARRLLQEKQLDFFPKMEQYNKNGLWIVEELIAAESKIIKKEIIREFLQHHALSLYKTTARARPLYKYVRIDTIENIMPNKIIKHIDFRQTWPIALCHGDLSPGNMVISKAGQLFVVDWELAHVGPVAVDLLKIYKDYPDFRKDVFALLDFLSYDSIEPSMQICIALAHKTVLTINAKERNLQYYVDLGLSKNHAQEKFDKVINENLSLIEELFD